MSTHVSMLSGHVHRFVPGIARGEAAGSGPAGRTLLLLHGTGGDETDLLHLGAAVAPGWALLSPRGNVSEAGMPRFFRRMAEGVFDIPDLVARTRVLAEFIVAAAERYGFDPAPVTALGYSNGANIAASLLLLRPDVLEHAVLLRPTLPLEPERVPELSGRRVLILSGRLDPYAPPAKRDRLAELLRSGGATVDIEEMAPGHALGAAEPGRIATWLAALPTDP